MGGCTLSPCRLAALRNPAPPRTSGFHPACPDQASAQNTCSTAVSTLPRKSAPPAPPCCRSRDYLEGQSWVLQGLFESHAGAPPSGTLLRLQLGRRAAPTAGGSAIASQAEKALQETQLARFLFQAYHPGRPLDGDEAEVLDLLAAADFFSDDPLKDKCDAALAELAARRLKGLHDPLPISHQTPTKQKRTSMELEDSATQVLQEHGSPVAPAKDEWDTEVHVMQANNAKARDREDLLRYLRLANKYSLPQLTAQCLPPLCKLIVAASTHHNLRHTIQEALPLLEEPAKTVALFEIAQLAGMAAGDEGLAAWELDPARTLAKLQEYESQEAALSKHASAV